MPPCSALLARSSVWLWICWVSVGVGVGFGVGVGLAGGWVGWETGTVVACEPLSEDEDENDEEGLLLLFVFACGLTIAWAMPTANRIPMTTRRATTHPGSFFFRGDCTGCIGGPP